jgi:hypothetical protein
MTQQLATAQSLKTAEATIAVNVETTKKADLGRLGQETFCFASGPQRLSYQGSLKKP